MTITPAQQQNIREVLWYRTRYKETFNELYDHVITSIEVCNDPDVKPHELAQAIIKNEFGGWDKLKELEAERRRAISSGIWLDLLTEFKNYFRLPLLVFTLAVGILAYFMAAHVSRGNMFLVFLGIAIIPMTLSWRMIPLNRWSKKFKRSIKEHTIGQLGSLGVSVANSLLILPMAVTDGHYKLFNQAHAGILAVLLVIYIVYVLSALKVLRRHSTKEAIA